MQNTFFNPPNGLMDNMIVEENEIMQPSDRQGKQEEKKVANDYVSVNDKRKKTQKERSMQRQ